MSSLPDITHIKQMEATLAQDPHSLVFAQLADAYRRGGRLEEAIQICQQGLSHHLTYASAYMVLGRSHKEKGDLLAAREAFQRVLDLDPESVLAHHFLGQIAEARDEIPEALGAYRAALILHPFDKEIRAARERLQSRTEGEVRTIPPEAPAIRQEPPRPEAEPLATKTLGDLYAVQGLHDQAAEIYGRVMAEAQDREDLGLKSEDALARGREAVETEIPASQGREEALRLLEAWRDAFARLRGDQREDPGGPVGLLEAWRDTFRKLKSPRGGTG